MVSMEPEARNESFEVPTLDVVKEIKQVAEIPFVFCALACERTNMILCLKLGAKVRTAIATREAAQLAAVTAQQDADAGEQNLQQVHGGGI